MKPFLLAVLILINGFNRCVQAAVEVVPFRVEESRSVAFGDDKVSRTPPALTVILSVSGPEAESCIRYGDLKLEAAIDDKGASLIPAKDDFNDATKFKEYSNAFFRKSNFGGNNGHPAAPEVELKLAPAMRAATKIARLRGTISLAEQGTIRTNELTALRGAGQKTFALPADAHLGITAKVAADDVRSIDLEITGDESALESLEVVDASGRKVSSGMSSWSFNGGPAHKSISLNKPLDDSMRLVARVAMDRKIIKVPFDIKDIALP